ncbi:MAG TPA: biotin carboxylase N-terminal domain-containing protein, partial [Candidatus Bipolaricaulota bacterium]
MFKKVLIANRGEIALRVIDACHHLGIQTVAVFSQADRGALHARLADESYCIGPAPAAQSYLNVAQIMSVAEVTGADALHPGYGFLAENAHFVEVCEETGLKFIGPSAPVMAATGDKLAAKRAAKAAGVPVVPGSELIESEAQLREVVAELGYPLMLKASAGGGGRGMRVINDPQEIASKFNAAQRESQAAFGRWDLYVEKLLQRPRHVEVQILADEHGHVVHWGDRDCSVQRRYQKLIEEAPAPELAQELQADIRKAAVKVAQSIGYTNAGTVEFLVEDDRFFFIEINARIQVEHPVSEMLVGRDLVGEQIRLAAGEPLGYVQRQLRLEGHAIECRINAEDPAKQFMPSTGTVTLGSLPTGQGVRWDSALYT